LNLFETYCLKRGEAKNWVRSILAGEHRGGRRDWNLNRFYVNLSSKRRLANIGSGLAISLRNLAAKLGLHGSAAVFGGLSVAGAV